MSGPVHFRFCGSGKERRSLDLHGVCVCADAEFAFEKNANGGKKRSEFPTVPHRKSQSR